jgi:hypothetical protein
MEGWSKPSLFFFLDNERLFKARYADIGSNTIAFERIRNIDKQFAYPEETPSSKFSIFSRVRSRLTPFLMSKDPKCEVRHESYGG